MSADRVDSAENAPQYTEESDTDPTDAEPTGSPPWLSVGFGVGLAALATGLLALGAPLSGAVGTVGLATLASALVLGSKRLCTIAGAVFALAVVAGGIAGATAAPLVAATIVAIAAWDVTDHGLELGRQVGREAVTVRNELVHAVVSLAIGGAAGAVAFGGFLAAAGGQPVAALTFFLFGAIALLAALHS